MNIQCTPIYWLRNDNKENQYYIKRDDLIPVSFGGNKARKAPLFFEELRNGKYDCVVTYGTSSSNHCRIIANMAASQKLDCYIISPEESFKTTFNSKMISLFGANVKNVPIDYVHDTIEDTLCELKKDGKKPYFIPGGGHGNTGTQAYVECYKEIKEYEKENNVFFDYIFFASGTGTTQAGLVCGQIMYGDTRNIVGISIARRNPKGRQIVLDSVQEYLETNDESFDQDQVDQSVVFVDDYTENGYGNESTEIENIINKMIIQNGIPMDFTYTGKAYLGMNRYVEKNSIYNKNILFIHTGGTPLFFDYLANSI